MKLSIFGLGYVGCVSAACLAFDGHEVLGVDISEAKVRQLNEGISPILEPGLDERIAQTVASGRLRATSKAKEAVHMSELSLVCVGTPSQPNGSLDLKYVISVCSEIGAALAQKDAHHTVVIRSTVTPGTVRNEVIPTLERCSGKKAGLDFDVCMNPEFLREGSAIKDYYQPPYIIIGNYTDMLSESVADMYHKVAAPVISVNLETAEMVKYANNAFHALKVAFANEIGVLSKAQGVDGREVMDIVCQDTQLNISATYLKPGFAFGGSCLPKDLRALTYQAKANDLDCPLLSSVVPSNKMHIERAINMVERTGHKKVAVLGLSFKPDTDDVRESPMIPLIETLIGRGYQVSVYDKYVDPISLVGANKSFLEKELPHITSLMRPSIAEVTRDAEVVVLAHNFKDSPELNQALNKDQTIIDLVGNNSDALQGNYDGICW